MNSHSVAIIKIITPTVSDELKDRLGTQMVEVHVGVEPIAVFKLHVNVLKNQCAFFQMKLRDAWKVKTDDLPPIELPNEDFHAFELYADWLYDRTTLTRLLGDAATLEPYERLVDAYIIGEFLQDKAFQNAVIDGVVHLANNAVELSSTLPSTVYQAVPPDSPLRSLLVEIYAWCGAASWLQGNDIMGSLEPEFLRDLAVKLFTCRDVRMADQNPPFAVNTCLFHDHSLGAAEVCAQKAKASLVIDGAAAKDHGSAGGPPDNAATPDDANGSGTMTG